MSSLETIARLSHRFGTPRYVKGGGGNTSCKSADTLWVKPSGTTLAGMAPATFVALDRAKIARLYEVAAPDDASAREALVKDIMAAAVLPDSAGRPSVEAPLHDSFQAVYVVHTHPALVNGLTCAAGGKAACAQLFPDALWVDYIDPGYTLCMHVRQAIGAYRAARGREPSMVLLKNHGVFIAGDEPEAIERQYDALLGTLAGRYRQAGVAMELPIGPDPEAAVADAATERIRQAVGTDDAAAVRVGGAFDVFDGPVTPDHIVYAKAYPLRGQVTRQAVAAYAERHGYPPRVVAADGMVAGLGTSPTRADLALELARDGALVKQLAAAFGGLEYMTQRALDFIDHWEVESYRQKQI
ncbi:MAG: class II aldolase [Planctomycetes bacterium]|nr:class II aldolase [Planctomycetota bacterium]